MNSCSRIAVTELSFQQTTRVLAITVSRSVLLEEILLALSVAGFLFYRDAVE